MCLDIRNNQRRDKEGNFIPSVAKKDIICYKWVERSEGKLVTPYYTTIVRIGQIMKTKKLGITYGGSVNEGIHAFTSLKLGKSRLDMPGDSLIRCIIPKGTQYIRGSDGDIVATKMKLKKIIFKLNDNYKVVNLERKKKK